MVSTGPAIVAQPNDNHPTPDLGQSSSQSVWPSPVAPFLIRQISFGRLGISGFSTSKPGFVRSASVKERPEPYKGSIHVPRPT
jgi:hypothetical protein